MENRSTVPPASAILMTAASPARPPPTTIILGDAAMVILESFLAPYLVEAGMGGSKRKGAATRFQKLIWPMAMVRKAISRSEKYLCNAAKSSSDRKSIV